MLRPLNRGYGSRTGPFTRFAEAYSQISTALASNNNRTGLLADAFEGRAPPSLDGGWQGDMSLDGRKQGAPGDQTAMEDLFFDVADEKFLQEVHTFRRLSGYETSVVAKGPYDDFGLEDCESAVAHEKASPGEDDGALPYSKAKCIALVTTVVGASFTAVSTNDGSRPAPHDGPRLESCPTVSKEQRKLTENRPSPSRPSSSSCPR